VYTHPCVSLCVWISFVVAYNERSHAVGRHSLHVWDFSLGLFFCVKLNEQHC